MSKIGEVLKTNSCSVEQARTIFLIDKKAKTEMNSVSCSQISIVVVRMVNWATKLTKQKVYKVVDLFVIVLG